MPLAPASKAETILLDYAQDPSSGYEALSWNPADAPDGSIVTGVVASGIDEWASAVSNCRYAGSSQKKADNSVVTEIMGEVSADGQMKRIFYRTCTQPVQISVPWKAGTTPSLEQAGQAFDDMIKKAKDQSIELIDKLNAASRQ